MTTGLSPEAQQDLQDIRAYHLKNAGARVVRHVAREIVSAFAFLAATLGAGHTRADLTSEAVKFWPVFSYLIVYDPAMKPLGIARVCTGVATSNPCSVSVRPAPEHAADPDGGGMEMPSGDPFGRAVYGPGNAKSGVFS